MKRKISRLTLIFIGLLALSLGISTCSAVPTKEAPEYKGVDRRVAYIVKEYKELAKLNGITFKNEVTIGFKTINDNGAVGLTTYGENFREIDIDENYWYQTGPTTHLAIVMHELSHAYCDRRHDFGDDKLYPEPIKIEEDLRKGKLDTSEGYYKGEMCPLSIMYPIILDKDCFISHYSDYTQEMFSRCISY